MKRAMLRCGWGLTLLWIAACGGSDATAPPAGQEEPATAGCRDGTLTGTAALYRVCFPSTWNGDLVVYAHGYVKADEPLAIPDDQVQGQAVQDIVTGLGYAYATTSYRANGLVADQGAEDVASLVETVRARFQPDPARTFLVGVSEGGLVAALAAEQRPELFAGALLACGPVGDFRAQIDYFGDFRVLFDYYFPGVIPGPPFEVPDSVRAQWESTFVPKIAAALLTHPAAALELLAVAGAPFDATDPTTVGATTLGVLDYDIFALPDAEARLGGEPYDNSGRVYTGSSDDAALNAGVARITADPAARQALDRFETSGMLTVPVSAIFTTGDPIVPSSQSSLYADKLASHGAGDLLRAFPITRYGHCTFTRSELLDAFGSLLGRAAAAARID